MERKIIVTRKPRKCPECGCHVISRIMYGYPNYNAEMEKEIAEGQLRLGGCCQESGSPSWQCSECDCLFYRERDISEEYDYNN